MSKQTRSTTATATKAQQKPVLAPAQEMVAAPEMAGLWETSTSLQSSAQQLNNPNLQRIQRQMMAGRIGRMRGNGHLQQAVKFRQNRADVPYQQNSDDKTTDGREISTESSKSVRPREYEVPAADANMSQKQGELKIQQRQNTQIVQRDILDAIPDSIRSKAAGYARNVPGYTLLTVALGKDPIAGTEVDRSPTNLIRGVIGLIPGGDMIFRNLQESGAIQTAFDWVQEQIGKLGLTWSMVQGLLSKAVKRLSATDIFDPFGAFNKKIKPLFLPIFRKIKRFVLSAGEKLLEFVFEGAMKLAGPGAGRVLGIIKKAGGAIKSIIKDPIGFLGNLISGVRLGFNGFKNNIGTHLKKGFIGWLTGSIAQAGIKLPDNWNLPGIFQLVMQVLGVSSSQLMGRVSGLLGFDLMGVIEPVQRLITLYQEEGMVGLAKMGLSRIIGEERMSSLMNVFNIFDTLRSGNLGQLWEMIKGYLGNIKSMIFGKIREYISETVIKQGVSWVVGLFNPAGAVFKACSAIYDIIMFFVREGSRIMPLVESVTNSIASLAGGNIGSAAKAIESSLGRTIPLAIGFMASLLKLGDLPAKIRSFIQDARGMVNEALDKLFNSKPVQMVAGFLKKIIGKMTSLAKGGIMKVKGLATAGFEKAKGWAKSRFEKTKSKLGLGKDKEKKAAARQAILTAEAPYIQNGEISREDSDKAASKAVRNPLFQSISVIDGGDSWDYKYVFRKGGRINNPAGKAGDGTVNLDELRGYRPGWRESTREELAAIYPEQHQEGTSNIRSEQAISKKGNTYSKALFDRRHITAFDEIKSEIIEKVHGQTYRSAAEILGGMKYHPVHENNDGIVKAVKKYLTDKFNDITNVFVGDAEENQERGREMGRAKSELEAAMTSGTQQRINEAYEKYKSAAFDPEPIDYFYDKYASTRNRQSH